MNKISQIECKIYTTHQCDNKCWEDLSRLDKLHSDSYLSDSDFLDLLKDKLDLLFVERQNKRAN